LKQSLKKTPVDMCKTYLDWMERYYENQAEASRTRGLAWNVDFALLRNFRDARIQWELLYGDWEVNSKEPWAAALKRMRDPSQKYSDENIYLIAQATLQQAPKRIRESILFIDSLLDGKTRPPRRGKLTSVIAPVHRTDHWVFYGVRRYTDPLGTPTSSAFFANSNGDTHRTAEIERVVTFIRAVDPSFPRPKQVRRVRCPIQTDKISCGVFASEALRRFVAGVGDSSPWPSLMEMRAEHVDLVLDYIRRQ
jgi:hypothetical protein